MVPMSLLLAAAVPAPTEMKIFGDWGVACDNGRRCEMTSLIPGESGFADEGSGDDVFSLLVTRAPGPAGGFVVTVDLRERATGARTLETDGKPLARLASGQTSTEFTGAEAERIVAAMIQGKQLWLTGSPVKGHVSLAGSSAALRYIDAGQGRAGTVTAAVAKGAAPASAVPAAPALPRVQAVKPAGRPAPISAALRASMGKGSDCDKIYVGSSYKPETERHALGGGKTLVLIPCGAGAYNFSTVPYVVAGGKAVVARFDMAPSWGEEGSTMLVNASWDARTGRLTSYAKGRGIGDCGASQAYVWDGAMFRLVEARTMGECRGSANWLTTWRAEAVAQ